MEEHKEKDSRNGLTTFSPRNVKDESQAWLLMLYMSVIPSSFHIHYMNILPPSGKECKSSFSHADQETSKKTNIPLVLVQTNQLNMFSSTQQYCIHQYFNGDERVSPNNRSLYTSIFKWRREGSSARWLKEVIGKLYSKLHSLQNAIWNPAISLSSLAYKRLLAIGSTSFSSIQHPWL